MKLNKLHPLEENPFKSTGDEQIQMIAKSIKEFEKMMYIRKIIIDEKNEILGGNKRYHALVMLGYTEIPNNWIDKRTDLTEEEKKRFIVTDNGHYGSTWDVEMLREWGASPVWGVDIPRWEYLPATAPETNYGDITKEQIEKEAQRLANQMLKERMKKIECICPECGAEFSLDA